jgi:hypothetical protein
MKIRKDGWTFAGWTCLISYENPESASQNLMGVEIINGS